MFSNLRTNAQIYILHKDATPYIEVGQVMNVTAPLPQLTQVGQPLAYTVDITVKVGEQTLNYQRLPANAEIADFAGNGNVFVSCTREGINAEVQAMRQRSFDIVSSVEYHQGVIAVCDKIIQQLNPEIAERATQQAEITLLKTQMKDMSQNISLLMEQNRELIEQLKGEKTPSIRVKKQD